MKVPAVKQKRIAAEDLLLSSLPLLIDVTDVGTRWSVSPTCAVCVRVCARFLVINFSRLDINRVYTRRPSGLLIVGNYVHLLLIAWKSLVKFF